MKKGAGLRCYYCGHEDEDCSAGASGIEVSCQTSNEEEPHYGDSCFVGHSGIVAYIQSLVQTNYYMNTYLKLFITNWFRV